jgi:hypothetical protein
VSSERRIAIPGAVVAVAAGKGAYADGQPDLPFALSKSIRNNRNPGELA